MSSAEHLAVEYEQDGGPEITGSSGKRTKAERIGSEVAQAIESGAGHGSANEAEVETVIAVGQGSGAAGEVARASESAADLASASAAAPLTESATEGSAAVSVGGTEAPVERGGADRNTGSNSLEKLSRKYAFDKVLLLVCSDRSSDKPKH
ncbi:hypothetical protein ANCCEY_12797 [Ancylostoma ceylanicum]|uniref:Uncharacterized protein n=1 Tax=Ancylostoma ceylanicum TaxID=53326 RepID=A0A0D6LDV6_9BILA|nr:hypothetical protein ANCCEY_12797 [Ancylostoma ceylanicum]